MTIEQSELREKIAREIRMAMAESYPVLGAELRERSERVAYEHADAIMAMIAALGAKP